MTAGDGLPCKKCGTSRWYKGGACVKCQAVKGKEWQKANPDKRKQIAARFRENRREQRRAESREYSKNNLQKGRERTARWRKNNPERAREVWRQWKVRMGDVLLEYRRNWYYKNRGSVRRVQQMWESNNPQKSSERYRRYRQKHASKVNAWNNCRRARKLSNGGTYTANEWQELCSHYGNKCLRCGRTDLPLSVDHIIPLSLGGANVIENIQPLCKPCNSSKGNRYIDYRPYATMERWIQKSLF